MNALPLRHVAERRTAEAVGRLPQDAVPAVGTETPDRTCIRVDFPEPLAPIRATREPAATSSVTGPQDDHAARDAHLYVTRDEHPSQPNDVARESAPARTDPAFSDLMHAAVRWSLSRHRRARPAPAGGLWAAC